MTEMGRGTMTELQPIVRTVMVRCTPERAFQVFTDQLGSWWPVDSHSRAASDFEGTEVRTERVEVQGRTGGTILEHLSNGQVLPWGEILAWEPPRRLAMAWKPHGRPVPPTEVEVRFAAEKGGTMVTLEHRGWERLGPVVGKLRGEYASGWRYVLGLYRDAADKEVA